jgi:hypothetical protein
MPALRYFCELEDFCFCLGGSTSANSPHGARKYGGLRFHRG